MQVIMTARLFSLGLLLSVLGLFVVSLFLILSFIIISISLLIIKLRGLAFAFDHRQFISANRSLANI